MSGLAERIEAAGARLGQRVLDAMYEDPFWDARYGARGRMHADEDSAYHVRYLLEALRSDDARIMTRYATWLRSVLVTRGMCSAHLDDNFARLAQALEGELGAAEPALRMLREARVALAYDGGPGAQLLARSAALRASVEMGLSAAERAATIDGREEHARFGSMLSYLADALQLGRPDLFRAHATFLADFYRRRGRSAAPLVQLVRALAQGVRQLGDLEADTARAALTLLGAAERALSGVRAQDGAS